MIPERYDPKSIEKKWQDRWEAERVFAADEKKTGPKGKFYVLDMYPYPSAQGLHVGHPEGYTATDIVARKRRMEGWNVLHPMGWDSFGLPAENYAIKIGGHPRDIIAANVENFRRQIKSFGFSYDWEREISTSQPEYYKWTQWLFLLLYKNGLAYKKSAPVNWCNSCQTVLANEQVEDGKCERCKNVVIQKNLEQWFFGITQYADKMLAGLDQLDWPDKIKAMQKNWIGRSEGVEVDFRGRLEDGGEFDLPVFTTRVDTLYSGTFIVLAPEHPLVGKITTEDQKGAVAAYVEATRKKSELERTGTDHEKTGVFTGAYVSNPVTGELMSVWIADFVLAQYGTGAVFADAHDERDFEFAKKYDIPLKTSIRPADGRDDADIRALKVCFSGEGVLYNSDKFDGLTSAAARRFIVDELESLQKGRRQVNYHLRDWLVSRQRYWGAPIPIIYCAKCGEVPVPESDLPVLLPNDVDFRPTGEPPLARSKTFHDVKCPKCGELARRESDTMDMFVDSAWYFLRFADPKNAAAFASPEALDYWCPIDLYVGGAEHAVKHLLYARFLTMVLHDLGYLKFTEPFKSLRNQGLIMGEDGEKMSKSRGNVVNPDDVIADHGADVTRLFEMFIGEFEQAKPWNTQSIIGLYRFLDKVWRQNGECVAAYAEGEGESTPKLKSSLHKTLKKVTDDIENFKFNTAISAMMIFVNGVDEIPERADWEMFLKVLSPFAPHIAEELWSQLGHPDLIAVALWPTYDPKLTVDAEVEVVLQVLGKVKDRITVPKDLPEEELKRRAMENEKVMVALAGKTVRQVIVVPNRLINIVAN
jgi:leucyl-tRNA synthetase